MHKNESPQILTLIPPLSHYFAYSWKRKIPESL